MGRYGLDWTKGLKNFTDKDWNIVLTETTKIIDAKKNMKEVALSLNDRGIVYHKKKEFDKAILDCVFRTDLNTNYETLEHKYQNI